MGRTVWPWATPRLLSLINCFSEVLRCVAGEESSPQLLGPLRAP